METFRPLFFPSKGAHRVGISTTYRCVLSGQHVSIILLVAVGCTKTVLVSTGPPFCPFSSLINAYYEYEEANRRHATVNASLKKARGWQHLDYCRVACNNANIHVVRDRETHTERETIREQQRQHTIGHVSHRNAHGCNLSRP